MIGKTCIVTGSNAGIGQATALGLAKMGATVIMICRNEDRGLTALAAIKKESDNESIHLIVADLASGDSIRRAVTDFKDQFDKLDVLINNAAVIPQSRTETVDGLETQFAVNYLAGFHLTSLLLGALKKSDAGRIVNVSSNAHKTAALDFSDLQSRQSYNAQKVYQTSKLANVLFTYELARRLTESGTSSVTANCLHPGVISTQLLSDYSGTVRVLGFLRNRIFGTPKKGAETSLYLAISREIEGVSGKYFVNCKMVPSSAGSYNHDIAARLWSLSENLITG